MRKLLFLLGLVLLPWTLAQADDFTVSSADDWQTLVSKISGGEKTLNVKLATDITVTSPLTGGYSGTFDGQGHTITLNLGAEGDTKSYSLFTNTSSGFTIRNVVFEGTLIGGGSTCAIAGQTNGTATIENVVSKVNVTGSNGNCSGFIGFANGNVTIKNAIFAGKVKSTKDAGGFVGWADGKTFTMDNCAMVGDVTVDGGARSMFLRVKNTNTVKMTNCYYAITDTTFKIQNGNGSEIAKQATAAAADDVASGKLCYLLNGDQSAIAFYQTIGTDAAPTISSASSQVYANGHKHCDGTDYEGVTYSNTAGQTEQDEHNYVDNVCSYCGTLLIADDGYFHVASAAGWDGYVKKHNAGTKNLKVKLDTDITVTSPLGGGFSGEFDGQGHTVTLNMGTADSRGKYSLFDYTSSGVNIHDVVFDGTLYGTGSTCAIASQTNGAITVKNVISKINVSGNNGNCAGLIGFANGNVTMTNVIFAGKIQSTKDAGGLVGWADGKTFTLNNCAVVGEVTVDGGARSIFLRVKNTNTVNMTNCYYVPSAGTDTIQNGNGPDIAKTGKALTADAVASGQLCYSLNGDQSEIAFYQKIGEDELPSFDSTRGQVYANGRKHCDGTDYADVAYSNTEGQTVQDEHQYTADNICSVCGDLKIDDGYFHVVSKAGWDAFVAKHNAGTKNINIKLDVDTIVVTEGLSSKYAGTFDGQGHTITLNLGTEGSTASASLFGTVSGLNVRNLVIEGTLIGGGGTNALASRIDGTSNIENVISKVNVTGAGNSSGFIGFSNGAANFKNCIFAGKVTASEQVGGFVGWADNKTFTFDNCAMVGDVVGGNNTAMFARVKYNCKANMTNCYFVPNTATIQNGNTNKSEEDIAPLATQTTTDMVTGGGLCYNLNGDQSAITFYQKIGEDELPSFDATRGQVYAAGHKHCDGTDYDGMAYTNTKSETVQDEHNFEDNVCTYCGELQLDENGIFHIVSAKGFAGFSKTVTSKNQPKLSAVLDEDVAVEIGTADCPMVGSTSVAYAGTLDGQGHTLDVTVDAGTSNAGVFLRAAAATIRNITFTGSINGAQAGLVAESNGGGPTFENVINKLKITGTVNVGGFVGFSNANYKHTFKNCLFAGKVTYAGEANKNGMGGFVGWSSTGSYDLNSCGMVGEMDMGGGTTASLMARVNVAGVTSTNCGYVPVEGVQYVNGSGSERNGNATSVETAADGQLCYVLNGKSFKDPVWFQNVGEDDYPTLDTTHNVVFPGGEGYISADVNDESSTGAIIKALQENAENYVNGGDNYVQKSISDAYLSESEKLTDCANYAEIKAAYYPTIDSLRTAAEASAASYAEYVKKVDDTKAYLTDHASDFKGGPIYDMLSSYLGDDAVDPSDDEFPNGSYAYIIDSENRLLGAAQLASEEQFVDSLLKAALNEGLKAGADVTTLLANADFSDGLNHWEGNPNNMSGSRANTEGTLYTAYSWTSTGFDMSQTISVPENGIYELTLNGAYRFSKPTDSYQQSAMVYLNDNVNYLPANMEGFLPVADAVDKQNCLISADYAVKDGDGNTTGYVLNQLGGAPYAFSAGRYADRILVNVTDNKLTVGVRNGGDIYNGNEWVALANLKLTYRGTIDEAGLALDSTLASMKERAEFMLSSYEPDQENYRNYPNFSQSLKDSLSEAVAAIATTTESADKYALVEKLSTLFKDILACKKAYAEMMPLANGLYDGATSLDGSGLVTSEQMDEALAAYEETINGFNNGTYTKEEAENGGAVTKSSIFPTKNDEGAYQIDDAAKLNVFAATVNAGLPKADAVLTTDIVADPSFMMIGTDTYAYSGKFDGQGHKLTLAIDLPDATNVGVFKRVAGATILNTIFDGSINGKSQVGGVVGATWSTLTVKNVESRVAVTATGNAGGLIGYANKGPQYIDNFLFSGSVKVSNAGGGGVVGWSNGNTINANNVLSVGTVSGNEIAYLFRVKGKSPNSGKDPGADQCVVNGTNLYYLKTSSSSALSNGTPSWGEFLTDVTTEVSEDQLKSGEITYKLNSGNTSEPAWLQTIGEDTIPQLFAPSKVVFYDSDKDLYYNEKPVGIDEVKKSDAAKEGKESNAPMYDLSGQRIFKPLKGTIYIQGGKKKIAK